MSALFKQQNDRQYEQFMCSKHRIRTALVHTYHIYNSNRSIFILGRYLDDDNHE